MTIYLSSDSSSDEYNEFISKYRIENLLENHYYDEVISVLDSALQEEKYTDIWAELAQKKAEVMKLLAAIDPTVDDRLLASASKAKK